MIEILRRVALDENGAHTAEAVRSGTSTPEEDEVGSSHALSEETASRIEKKLARGEEILESDLSLEEWRRFVRDISAGRATASLLTWSPWWLSGAAQVRSRTNFHLISLNSPSLHCTVSSSFRWPLNRFFPLPCVQDLKLSGAGQALIRDDSTESEASSLPGAWDVPLPPLSSLTRAQPSPHLATLLVGALHGYVSAARLYLGDWVSEPSAASSDTLSLSPSLLRKIPAGDSVMISLSCEGLLCLLVSCPVNSARAIFGGHVVRWSRRVYDAHV